MKCIFRKKKEDFTVIDIRYLEHGLINRLRNLIKYCTGGLLHGAIEESEFTFTWGHIEESEFSKR